MTTVLVFSYLGIHRYEWFFCQDVCILMPCSFPFFNCHVVLWFLIVNLSFISIILWTTDAFSFKNCLLVAYRKKWILWPFTYWYDTYISIDLNKDVASNFGIFHWEMLQNFLCPAQFIWDAVTVILYMSFDLVVDWCLERFTVSECLSNAAYKRQVVDKKSIEKHIFQPPVSLVLQGQENAS